MSEIERYIFIDVRTNRHRGRETDIDGEEENTHTHIYGHLAFMLRARCGLGGLVRAHN